MDVKVVYLVGTTRCGSTLLGSLLDQVPGIVHVGELSRIWEEGLVHNYRCGCGTPLKECEFWSDVLGRAFGGKDPIDVQLLIDAAMQWGRTRHVVRLATARGRERTVAGMADYTDAVARVYRSIAEVSGDHIVLDSSKSPILAWVLAERPDIDLRILHLTRDPRAVAFSWQRVKFDPAKGADMRRESTLKTSLGWLAWNGLAASIWERPEGRTRYLHVRYEDLTEDPRAVLDRILGWLGEPIRADQVVGPDRRYDGRPAHTVAGNPMRFANGEMKIRADTEWLDRGSRWDSLVVSGLTWPLLGKYRYPIFASRRRRA
jgi:hypothetical protein